MDHSIDGARGGDAVRREPAGRSAAGAARGTARWPAGCGRPACAIYVVHVFCAFGLMHDWSHAAAYRHTAARTAELVGLDWGGGLYLNHVFTAIWIGDALWWWLRPATYQARPLWARLVLRGFLALMMFQATVVFGSRPAQVLGGAIFVAWGAKLPCATAQKKQPARLETRVALTEIRPIAWARNSEWLLLGARGNLVATLAAFGELAELAAALAAATSHDLIDELGVRTGSHANHFLSRGVLAQGGCVGANMPRQPLRSSSFNTPRRRLSIPN